MPRILALLVVALALLAAGCGEDDGGNGGGGGGGGSAEAEAGDVSGTGYTLDTPEGWRDGTDEAKTGAINFDLVLVGERRDEFTANVNILREKPRAEVSVDELAEAYRPQLEGLGAKDIERDADLEVGGDPALVHDYSLSQQGRNLRGRQVAVPREGYIYTTTLTTTAPDFEDDATDFEQMLSSWRWTD